MSQLTISFFFFDLVVAGNGSSTIMMLSVGMLRKCFVLRVTSFTSKIQGTYLQKSFEKLAKENKKLIIIAITTRSHYKLGRSGLHLHTLPTAIVSVLTILLYIVYFPYHILILIIVTTQELVRLSK